VGSRSHRSRTAPAGKPAANLWDFLEDEPVHATTPWRIHACVLDSGLQERSKASVREQIVSKLWNGEDPMAGIVLTAAPDLQGWNSQHPMLCQAVETNPRIVIEVGVWKGASVIHMAKQLKQQQADAVVIAIDTWLGSWEHWIKPKWRPSLHISNGYPKLYWTFMNNVIANGVKDYVIPLPLDSHNAFEVIQRVGITPDVIHLDGGHDYRAVINDLNDWWSILQPSGLLIADDYDPSGTSWPSVRAAVDDFRSTVSLAFFDAHAKKCLMKKAS
jgi:predicted O-methyltransferase YrrM